MMSFVAVFGLVGVGVGAKGNGVLMAVSSWFDPGSAVVKTVQALGAVALVLSLVAGLGLLLLGAVRCWEVWKRRTVNRRAVISLVVVLTSWLLVYVSGALAFTVYRTTSWVLAGLAMAMFCAGIGLAVSGLGQMRRHPRWFNYGGGHAVAAIWAGAFPLALALLAAGGLAWVYRGDFGMLRLLAKGYYDSEAYGYRVKLSGGLWKRWPEEAGRIGGSEFAVLGMMEDQGLFVLPVWLGGQAKVDTGAVAEAVLAEVGRKPGEPRMRTVAAPGGGVPDERHFVIFIPREKSGISYRYRVAAHRGVGYLIGAWMDQRQGVSEELLDEQVMRVSLAGGEGLKIAEGSMKGGVADLHARLYRRMAAYLTRHGASTDAAKWASEAQKLDGGVAAPAEEVPGTGEALGRAIFALDAGEGRRALDVTGGILWAEPTNRVALAVKALALGETGQLSEGLRVIEAGIKAYGQDPALAAAADFLRARKAEDVGAVLDVAVDAVEVPRALFQVDEVPAGAEAVGAGYDWAVTGLRFRRGEPLVTTRYGRVRVLSEPGLSAFPAIVEAFDPRVELPHVNRAVVLDEKGGELRKIEPGKWRVEGKAGEGVARLMVDLGGLRVGNAVEWAVTFRRAAPALKVPFMSHCFSRSLPVRRSVLWVEGDFKSVAATSSSGVPKPVGQPRPHWIVENPPAEPAGEPLLPPGEVYLPHVWFGETSGGWPRLASEYLDLVGERVAPTEAVRGAARAATAGVDGTEAKVGVLARYVQGELEAVREGYGAGARLPGRAADALSAKRADSRGHAAALHALLAAEGIESSLALVCAGGLFHEGIPALEHFNRMLVFVPGLAQQFVDCYQKEGDPMGTLPAEVAARRALVLDPKQPRLIDVPASPAVAAIGLIRRARLAEKGEIVIDEEAEIRGAMPAILGERVGWRGGSEAFCRAFLAEAKGVDVRALEVSGGGKQGPIRIKIAAVLRPRGEGDARVPALLETLILDPGPVGARKGPAWIGSAVAIRARLEVSDEKGAVAIPVPDVRLVGRRLVGCAFADKSAFNYLVERVPGLLTAENMRRLAGESGEVIGAIEPRVVRAAP